MVTQVYFDFFGTLVDYNPSVHPRQDAPLAFARRAGSTMSRHRCRQLWQRAWDELEADAVDTGREYSMSQVAQRYWLSIGAPPVAQDEFTRLIGEYLDAWTEGVSVAADALDCLTDLARDHQLTVVTNTHDPALVPRLVRRFGLDSAIDRVITSVDVGWRKPHPHIFEAALRERGASATDAVFVGDNWAADIEGPRAVGMSAIYVGVAAERRPSASLDSLPDLVRSLA